MHVGDFFAFEGTLMSAGLWDRFPGTKIAFGGRGGGFDFVCCFFLRAIKNWSRGCALRGSRGGRRTSEFKADRVP